MEVIKKTLKMAMTVSGITESEFAIVPDLNTFYNFKILLTSQVRDIGFFDSYLEPVTPAPPYYEYGEYGSGVGYSLIFNEDVY